MAVAVAGLTGRIVGAASGPAPGLAGKGVTDRFASVGELAIGPGFGLIELIESPPRVAAGILVDETARTLVGDLGSLSLA